MVIEEVDILELKSAQSKGYKVIKGFSKDYVIDFIKSASTICRFIRSVSSNISISALGNEMLHLLYKYNEFYGVGFKLGSIRGFIEHLIYWDSTYDKVAYIFLYKGKVKGSYSLKVCVASSSGIFVNDFDFDNVVFGTWIFGYACQI